MASRMLGFKLGIIFVIISFLYLTQTGLKYVLPIPVIDDFIDGFAMPVEVFGINFVIIAWIFLVLGIIILVIAALDLPPFNY